MKKHIVFDVDDTLTNSYTVNQQLFVDTFLKHDPNVDQQYLRDLHYRSRGSAMHLQFEEAIKYLKLDVSVTDIVKENEELHISSVTKFNNMKVFDSVKELLELIKSQGKLISACTNRQYGSQKAIFEANGLTKYFDNIISCKDEGHEKPDPYCFEQLIKKYNEPKDSYIYIGDSKTDRDFAENAGVDYLIIDHYLNKQNFYKMVIMSFLK